MNKMSTHSRATFANDQSLGRLDNNVLKAMTASTDNRGPSTASGHNVDPERA